MMVGNKGYFLTGLALGGFVGYQVFTYFLEERKRESNIRERSEVEDTIHEFGIGSTPDITRIME